MAHRGWVISGIILFVAAAAFPVYWYAAGNNAPFPDLDMPSKAKRCVESKEFMRSDHMRLLDAWRISVVRHDQLIYVGLNGEKHTMNLRETCLGCHVSKDKFCDRCHEYSGVTPPCWECHVAPQESDPGEKS
jgi:hypothetical protein